MKKNERIVCPAIWIDDGKVHDDQPHNISTGYVQFGIHLVDIFYRMDKRGTGNPLNILNSRINEVYEGYYTNMNRFIPKWIEY